MNDIGLHGLVKIINEGFQGEATFEGTVSGYIKEEDPKNGSQRVYEARGKFVLTPSQWPGRGYELRQVDLAGTIISQLNFNKREREEAKTYSGEKIVPGMSLPIDLHPRAVLTIVPSPRTRILY